MQRRGVLIVIASLVLAYLLYSYSGVEQPHIDWQRPLSSLAALSAPSHPIDDLIRRAREEAQNLERNGPRNVHEAAKEYRARRGRHPPPEFDAWVKFAQEKDCILSEELFDQIYHDLEPFWGMDPAQVRFMSSTWQQTFSFRDGKVKVRNAKSGFQMRWMEFWGDAIEEFAHLMPDVDIAIQNMDEPRVIAHWEDVNNFVQYAAAEKSTAKPTPDSPIANDYQKLPPHKSIPEEGFWSFYEDDTYWHKARSACHPDSPARKADYDVPFADQINWDTLLPPLDPFHGPYVSNWTAAKNPCASPHLRYLHGDLIYPSFEEVSRTIFPVFSNSKIAGVHNDILLPGAEYLSLGADDVTIGYGNTSDPSHFTPWESKQEQVFWRGSGTGGIFNVSTWKHFQRQRFVSMLNATSVAAAESLSPMDSAPGASLITANASGFANNFVPPAWTAHGHTGSIASWLKKYTDVAFTHLFCNMFNRADKCYYLDGFYEIGDSVLFSEIFTHKYLPDVDGQAYSARYERFIISTSVPIKATIFQEWHDDRLIPWYHFVPMDNSFRDLWGILRYFIGDERGRGGHDAEAKKIAEQGLSWGQRTLRREDMVVYMYRLFLEFARICDDRRVRMGWVEDL